MSETASFYRNQNRKIVDYPISEDRKTQFWRQKTLAIDVLTFRKDNKTEAVKIALESQPTKGNQDVVSSKK